MLLIEQPPLFLNEDAFPSLGTSTIAMLEEEHVQIVLGSATTPSAMSTSALNVLLQQSENQYRVEIFNVRSVQDV